MKSQCQVCNATFRGIPLITVKDAKKVEVCPSCYEKYDAEYRKNSCIACVFFNVSSCELFGTDLEEPYLQNASCQYFTTDADPVCVGMARIKKFEMTCRFEEAAKEYEKLGMQEKADEVRKKVKKSAVVSLDVDALIGQLVERGQTLTYFCCHCGAPLKVGAKHEVQKSCSKCHYDLSAIDMARLINQHL